jgi:hypothetical protein
VEVGSRMIEPEHDGQLSGEPLLSLVIRWSACAGLYEFGLGLRIPPPSGRSILDAESEGTALEK